MPRLFIPDRHELKYLIPEEQVEQVRAAIRPYCELDKYSTRSADHQYVINSLYLDTPRFDLYRVSREGRAVRFKVRVRRYGDGDALVGPVFLEVKRKSHGLVRKSRAQLPEECWERRLCGAFDAAATSAELSFWREVDLHALEPALLVRYQREAWFSTIDGYARVTFDRRIVCQGPDGWSFAADPSAWVALDHRQTSRDVPHAVLIELKCTRAVPRWMAALTARLELLRTGFSKYCNGVEHVQGRASPACDTQQVGRWPTRSLA